MSERDPMTHCHTRESFCLVRNASRSTRKQERGKHCSGTSTKRKPKCHWLLGLFGNRSSSVSRPIVSDYGMDGRAIEVRDCKKLLWSFSRCCTSVCLEDLKNNIKISAITAGIRSALDRCKSGIRVT
jgi:hypothetical protein